MRIYTKTEQCTIWENESNYTYQIQLKDKEIDSVVYDFAADAILAAEMMK